jgi:iron(III) transport system ATP-binding protein
MSVRLEGIRKEFADPGREGGTLVAVRDMDLAIREGEFVTLLGPSGCGKTTTLRMIAGFEQPTAGKIWIGNKMVNEDPPNRRDTTMVFQSYAIFPHMSVEQNVGFGLELKGRPRDEIRREVGTVMEVMGIAALAKRRPDQLSGGQQQRVALARAIVNRPGVLLFDEPLSNLDAKLRESMRVEIRRIQQSFGITSVYVTHDQAEAMTVSDRIVVMDRGCVMQVGTPFEIYSRPANRFVADFIGRVNLFPVGIAGRGSGGGFVVADGGAAGREIGSASSELATAVDGRKTGGSFTALLAVRPESLRLAREGERQGFGSGEVVRSVYLGAVVEYEIDAGFARSVLAISHDPVDAGFFHPGERISFDFQEKAAHLVPGE